MSDANPVSKHSLGFEKHDRLPFPGLNITRARGKWYVMTRKPPHRTFVRGFVGEKSDLLKLLQEPEIARIIAQCGTGTKREVDAHQDYYRLRVADRVILSARKRASANGLDFDLTKYWLLDRLDASHDACEVTGLPYDYRPRSQNKDWHKNPFAPSPDRIDRSRGYLQGNVRIVLTSVNIAINEWGVDHLRLIADAITSRGHR